MNAKRRLEWVHFRIRLSHRDRLRDLYEAADAESFSSRRELRQMVLNTAAREWCKKEGFQSSIADLDFQSEMVDSDRPFLDFLRELIEQGKFKEFFEWLIENLPKIIAIILSFL